MNSADSVEKSLADAFEVFKALKPETIEGHEFIAIDVAYGFEKAMQQAMLDGKIDRKLVEEIHTRAAELTADFAYTRLFLTGDKEDVVGNDN